MAKRIEVPGAGIVEFPDSMDDAAITKAIERDILPQTKQEAAPPPDSGNSLSNPAAPPEGIFQQLFGAGVRKAVTDTGVGLAKGALKGAGDTFFEAGKRLAANVGGTFVGPNPDVAKAPTPDMLVPHNPTEQAGFTGEQIGEYFIPGGAITKGEKAIKAATAGVRGAKAIKLIARPALEAMGMGGVTALKGGSGEDVATSAALGGGGALVSEAAKVIAPKLMHRALGIYGRDMQHGQTPGAALLNETSALTPGGIAKQAGQKSAALTQKMEAGVSAASAANTLSTDAAHDIVDNAIKKAPRNATTYKEKLQSLRDLLKLDGSNRRQFTPDEILEMKRGVEKEVGSWERDIRKSVDPVKKQIYRALDGELDKAIPGNSELNQTISSLITGKKAARLTDMGRRRGLVSQIAERAILPTIGAGVGGYEGGGPGAVGGLVGAMALQSPATKIAAARALNSPFWTMLGRAAAGAQAKTERRAR